MFFSNVINNFDYLHRILFVYSLYFLVIITHINPFQSDTLPKVTSSHILRPKVIGQAILHIPFSRSIILHCSLRKHSKCNYTTFQVDLDEVRRQSKMAANLKSHAVSQTTYTRADANFHAVWDLQHEGENTTWPPWHCL